MRSVKVNDERRTGAIRLLMSVLLAVCQRDQRLLCLIVFPASSAALV